MSAAQTTLNNLADMTTMMIDLYNEDYAIHVLNGTEGTERERHFDYIESFTDKHCRTTRAQAYKWYLEHDNMKGEYDITDFRTRTDILVCLESRHVLEHINHDIDMRSAYHYGEQARETVEQRMIDFQYNNQDNADTESETE